MPHIHDPGFDWTVEIFIVNGDACLLRLHDKYDVWLSVGGHIEIDEDPIEAALREVREEVGLDVRLLVDDDPIRESEDSYELPLPRALRRHRVSETHEHITLVYFAVSDSRETRSSGTDASDEVRWMTEEELLADESLYGDIRRYAIQAIHAAQKACR